GYEAREFNHFGCQLDDLYRLAHIKHVYFPSFTHGPGFQYQLARFGDGHEIPGNFGMGNRNRPAFFDLRLKAGDYRAVGAQHISEPCSDKPSSSAQGAATIKRSTLAREVIEVSLYIDFSYSFRRA